MKIILHKLKVFIVLFLLFAVSGNMIAQCTITGATPNATTYGPNPCVLLSGCGGILYIGNGTAATNLIMSTNLNLTCLGAIQLIVRNNASIDFSSGNNYLTLAAGSSIAFEGTGTLVGGGSCNASERIYIGTDLVASCNGNGPGSDYNFPGLVTVGGFNIVNISPTSASACGSGNFSFTATAVPSATATEVRWYSAATGGTLLQTTAGSSSTYPTPTISTTTTYYAEATIGAFVTPRRAVVATINPLPTTPTIGTITQPTCILATGSVVLSGLPATWTLTRSGTSSATTSGTGTSTTISGLALGTYAFTVSNGTCTSLSTANITLNSSTKTWNGSWSPSAPTITDNIVFAGVGTYSSTGDLSGCSCLVTSGTVNINAGHSLTLTNGLTVTGGTMFFKNNSSLVQVNNTANSGNITYERSIAPSIRDTDYTYWASPVTGFMLGNVYNNNPSSLFYSYGVIAGIEDWQQESAGTTMIVGKGYIINGAPTVPLVFPPLPPPPAPIFIGVPNNGNFSITGVVANKSYLLGNPYPSALDAEKFLNDNSGVLNGTLYFWTHNTEIGTGTTNLGTGALAYTSNDYAVYNATGGVAATQLDINPLTGLPFPGQATSGGSPPTGKIGAGQGFFGSSKATLSTTTITYTNVMRLDNLGNTLNNTQFFRTSNSKTKNAIEKNRIWLNLTNTKGAFKQTLVGYITGATNEYDNAFDGESFDGNEYVDFYTVNQNKNLVIQGRALPFDINDQVALGFRTTINGAFTIKIDQVDGLFTNQNVFLEDKLNNTIFDLKRGDYTFNTVAGTFNDRFVLRYTNKTLSTNEFDTLENQVLVLVKNKQIKIKSFIERINKVTIYDILGRQVYQKTVVDGNEFTITNLITNNQALVVKILLQNGQEVSKKIIY